MKKTFLYSLVVAAFLIGCGDKDGASVADSVKDAANGAVESTKSVAKDAASAAVESAKDAASHAVDAVKEGAKDAVEATKEAATGAVDAAKDAAHDAVEATKDATKEAAAVATGAVAATAEKVAEVAGDTEGKAKFAKCVACHGANGEKKALGASQVITGWDAAKSEAALKGYKDGSYGGAMKGVMKGQVASYSDADIAAVSKYISTLK